MKKALSCLGLALALVSIPQFVSANDTAKKVVEDQNTTKVVKKATTDTKKAVEKTAQETTEKVTPAAEEASKN